MTQGPQDPDANSAYQGTQAGNPPPYPGQPYGGDSQQPPPAGAYGPPTAGPYGYPYGYPYPVRRPTNTLAILALVFAFVFAPAAIVMGAIARRQIRRTGEDGMGLATAGFVMGIVFTVLMVAYVIVIIVVIAGAVHNINQQNSVNGDMAAIRAYLGF